MMRVTRNTLDQNEVSATQFNMQEQLNQMMLMMEEANRRNEESMKALKEVETTLIFKLKNLGRKMLN